MLNTADLLNERYNVTVNNTSTSDFAVNGIITHTFENEDDSWYPQPMDISSGKVSCCYLRKDISNSITAPVYPGYLGVGYIIPLWANNYDPLCFYPVSGGTAGRGCCGCGDYTDGTPTNCEGIENPGTCYSKGIDSSQAWLDAYYNDGSIHDNTVCSFNAKIANEFKTGIETEIRLREMDCSAGGCLLNNEFIIRAWSSDNTNPENVPIEAFYYIINYPSIDFSKGKEDAFSKRDSYYQQSGRLLDVVSIDIKIMATANSGVDIFPFALVTA
jgi:hypothetical protein